MRTVAVATILVAGVLVLPHNYANARTHYKGVIDEPNGHKISKIIMKIQAEVGKKINQEIHSHGGGVIPCLECRKIGIVLRDFEDKE
jgi:hypothetical protein